jgi:transposase
LAEIPGLRSNYATHKNPKVRQWLADHPRWVFHFTQTLASWINAVEGFFSAITRRRIRRGAFNSVPNLQDAITRDIRDQDRAARPVAWTKHADNILAKLARLPAPSE